MNTLEQTIKAAPQKALWRLGLILSLLVILMAGVTLLIGSYPLTPGQLLTAAQGKLDGVAEMVLIDYRLPRTLAAILVGGCLGMAGAIFQTLMRNPLASPDVIGFSAGASAGAMGFVLYVSHHYLFLGAIIGGLLTASLVLLMSWRNGLSTYRLVLVGIGFNFSLTAVLDLMLSRIDLNIAVEMNKWLAGTLNATTWEQVTHTAIGMLLLFPLAYWMQFSLDRLTLNDDLAIGLGIPVNKVRYLAIAIGVLLTALAVSMAGPIPFIAFVAGPIARSLLRNTDALLFTSALVGALIALIADAAARYLGNWVNMPTGVFTAIIGAPYLLWLLIGQIRRGQI